MENRLRKLRKDLGMTQETLAGRLGIGKSALSMIETGKAALSERNTNILVQEFNVNADWLKSGKGNMYNPSGPRKDSERRFSEHSADSVPLYDIKASKGLVGLMDDSRELHPTAYIDIPNLPKCDGAVYMIGDSMYPLLQSGDIIMYKKIKQIQDIFWGDMYLLSIDVDGEEYITVKYLQKSERPNYVRLVSQNPNHSDKDIEVDKILALAFVKASIRMNAAR